MEFSKNIAHRDKCYFFHKVNLLKLKYENIR